MGEQLGVRYRGQDAILVERCRVTVWTGGQMHTDTQRQTYINTNRHKDS